MRRPGGTGIQWRFGSAAVLIAAAVAAVGPAAAAIEDSPDAAAIIPVLNSALEFERSGVDVPWANAATGRTGVIRIDRTYYRGRQPCRDYLRITRGATPSEVRGTGCRVDKLRWEFQEAGPEAPAAEPARAGTVPSPPPKDARVRDAEAAAGPPPETPPPEAPPVPARKPPVFSLPTRSQL